MRALHTIEQQRLTRRRRARRALVGSADTGHFSALPIDLSFAVI